VLRGLLIVVGASRVPTGSVPARKCHQRDYRL